MKATRVFRILLLCHSFNSLSQRLFVVLKARGHEVSVELDIADSVTQEAVLLFKPDLLIAPFLKRRIPDTVWRNTLCWIVHPGPPGDRGPSALDWAILECTPVWGVTVLQANGDLDAGPVWASTEFAMRATTKASLYRREVTQAAVAAVLLALEKLSDQSVFPLVCGPDAAGHQETSRWRSLVKQSDRAIDWKRHTTSEVLARMRSADGQPGVIDELFGHACRIADGHAATPALMESLPDAQPGAEQAWRDGAVLRRTVDGGVWIGQSVRLDRVQFKLPVTMAFPEECNVLPHLQPPLRRDFSEWAELHYAENGPANARVGYLSFDFYNGAMSTRQCKALLAALQEINRRPVKVLVLLGGQDFFSNGIHLNCIEAAAHSLGEGGVSSAADASWQNINAMNDVALALISTTDRITIAALRGNAGAGGAFLALAADEVWAHSGVLLNPHYKNMGNLYGSEYWTYLMPKRLEQQVAQKLMQQRLPISASVAQKVGLIDRCVECTAGEFESLLSTQAQALASTYNLQERLNAKLAQRERDEATRPLAEYRKEELSRMRRNFYGFDPSYHVARYHFVNKVAHSWTPRHLALHRS